MNEPPYSSGNQFKLQIVNDVLITETSLDHLSSIDLTLIFTAQGYE